MSDPESSLKVGVFTGNRAEYGLLKPLIRALDSDPDFELALFVGGALLNKRYGESLAQIAKDRFPVTADIQIPEPGENGVTTAGAIAHGITACEAAFLSQELDALCVYADRYEGLAAVIAASHSNIPVVHIEGGDITEGGAFDDNVRHAMSKLSHLHLTSNSAASDVLISMGEEDWRIKNVGLLPFSDLDRQTLLSPPELNGALEFELQKQVVLFTMHSISSSREQTKAEVGAAFSAIRQLSDAQVSILITYPNDDNNSDIILGEIARLQEDNVPVHVIPSLGQQRYYSVLNLTSYGYDVVCMGNTSSIVKECVFFSVPGILIGTRQNGRLTPENVLKTNAEPQEILSGYTARHELVAIDNPYYIEGGVQSALLHMKSNLRNPALLRKIHQR